MVEAQQVEHYQHKAQNRNDKAAVQRILSKRRANHLALLVMEAYRKRARLKHGLQRLRLFKRVVASDGHLAAGDLGLHGGRGLDLVVQDDDDLAVVGGKVAGGFCERLGARRIKRDVHRIVLAGVRRLVYCDARDVLAGDKRSVRTRGNGAIRGGAGLERIAEVVGYRALLDIGTVGDSRLVGFVGKGVGAGKLELTGFANGAQGLFRVGSTGDLDQDLVVALHRHGSLGSAKGVDARLDNGAGFLHVFLGYVFPIGALGRKNHRKAALDVQALIDLLARRREHEHRADDDKGGDNKQPDVAAVAVAARQLRTVLLALRRMLLSCLFAFLATLLALFCALLLLGSELFAPFGGLGLFSLFFLAGFVSHAVPSWVECSALHAIGTEKAACLPTITSKIGTLPHESPRRKQNRSTVPSLQRITSPPEAKRRGHRAPTNPKRKEARANPGFVSDLMCRPNRMV